MQIKTRFVQFVPPQPLAGVGRETILRRDPQTERVLAKIDRVLRDREMPWAARWTLLDRDFNPLQLPATVRAPAVRSSRATHLDRCLQDLQTWLAVGLSTAAEAAGINRGTVYAWRDRGSDPRPGTAGAILRIHGLVASAVAVVGTEAARTWFHGGEPSPLDELIASRGNDVALTALSRRLRRALTAPPVPTPNPLLAATVDDLPTDRSPAQPGG